MRITQYGIGLALVAASALYSSGCATIPAAAGRFGEQMNEIKNPLDVPSRLTRGVRDGVLGGIEAGVRDPLLQTEQYKSEGAIVGTIRENPALDIVTEIGTGAGIGAYAGWRSGVGKYGSRSGQALRAGTAIGAGSAAVSRGIEEAVD